jgi:hypothetical protein
VPDRQVRSVCPCLFAWRAPRFVLAAPVLAILCASPSAQSPPQGIVITHVAAIAARPAFFSGKTVRIQGLLEATDQRWRISGLGDAAIRVVAPGVPLSAGRVEIVGRVIDVGSVARSDQSLSEPAVQAILPREDQRWPGKGDLVVCVAQSVAPAQNFAAPSLRAIVLDPARYLDSYVTVTGQFRGRNLFADLPDAIGFDRSEFVLAGGGAALWVTGTRPRGQGFGFDPKSRADANKWLEVEGTVHHRAGILWIEGKEVRLAPAPRENPAVPPPPPPPLQPPEVFFSVPSEGETDVSPAIAVRIQVSRPLDPASLGGHIKAVYEGAPGGTSAGAEVQNPPFSVTYDRVNRVVEIRFVQPLLRFRTMRIDLTDGITAPDGAPLKPWSVRFTMGG